MPNWCENYIVVSGPQAQLQKLVETRFDFNEIVPEPKWDGRSGERFEWRCENWGCKWNRCDESFAVSFDEQPTSRYGDEKNRWNCSSDEVPVSFNKVTLFLETPWSPAIPICEELEKRGLTISAYFFEPAIRFLGLRTQLTTRFFYQDGVVTFHNDGAYYEPYSSLKEYLSTTPLRDTFERLFSNRIYLEKAHFVENAPTLVSTASFGTLLGQATRQLNITLSK